MVEGKPYRYGLIVAGLCVVAVGLFIMVQERPHVYVTMCVLGATMVCVGTAWSLCQCYPKVDSECVAQKVFQEQIWHTEASLGLSGSRVVLPEVVKSQCRSCPALHLV
uniref:Barttin n=1 Tax=Nothobranchius furzeri TaxID=105023 RepID=A0A8C6PIP5_NOTFU